MSELGASYTILKRLTALLTFRAILDIRPAKRERKSAARY